MRYRSLSMPFHRTRLGKIHIPSAHRDAAFFAGSARTECSSEDVLEQFQSLEERGLLSAFDDGYEINDEVRQVAGNMLLFTLPIPVDCVRVEDGRCQMFEVVSGQAGIHDILVVDAGGGSVTLKAVSTAILLRYLEVMMTEAPLVSATSDGEDDIDETS